MGVLPNGLIKAESSAWKIKTSHQPPRQVEPGVPTINPAADPHATQDMTGCVPTACFPCHEWEAGRGGGWRVEGCRGPSDLTNISHNPFITSPPSTRGAKAFFDEQTRLRVFADGRGEDVGWGVGVPTHVYGIYWDADGILQGGTEGASEGG